MVKGFLTGRPTCPETVKESLRPCEEAGRKWGLASEHITELAQHDPQASDLGGCSAAELAPGLLLPAETSWPRGGRSSQKVHYCQHCEVGTGPLGSSGQSRTGSCAHWARVQDTDRFRAFQRLLSASRAAPPPSVACPLPGPPSPGRFLGIVRPTS